MVAAADEKLLHVVYGDELAAGLRARAPGLEPVVVREALRDGPLVPSPNEGMDAFVAARARHLSTRHGAAEAEVRDELRSAWARLSDHPGPVMLHVDEKPCVDCATFLACALELLHRAGRGVGDGDPRVSIARGADPVKAVPVTCAGLAAGAGVWRLLVEGDEAGLTLAAADLEGLGGIAGYPELPGLLVRRARGDVPLDEVRPS